MSIQVFQTTSSARWKRFKWTGRVLLFIFLFFLTILVFAVIRGSKPSVPNLEAHSRAFENTQALFAKPSQVAKYKGFRDFLFKKQKEEANDSIRKKLKTFFSDTSHKVDIPYIRAAFYTPWTKNTSFPALKDYGQNLNTIFPEWFFIDSNNTSRLQTRIDSSGLAQMRGKGLAIMPMLTNYNSIKKGFDPKLAAGILNDTVSRQHFIQQLIDTLTYYHCQGINVDIENIGASQRAALTSFQRDLYAALHAQQLTVTMDVAVQNEDYDYKVLSQYNDYVILMAYDQHTEIDPPGPISDSKWIEESLDWTAARISANKIILGMAAYGFDWATDMEGKRTATRVTYADAINTAKIAGAKIVFDNNGYNVHYDYTVQVGKTDSEVVKHEVWFTDAASLFNIMRFSDEYATAGTAIWNIGGEDPRIWNFYAHDLSNDSLATNNFNFASFTHVPKIPNSVGYIDSSGEVLDIISPPSAGNIKIELDSSEVLISEETYVKLPSGYLINKFGEDTTVGKGHKVILTFDDGPDPRFTPQILDILEREKVPATFFVVGMQAENNIPIFQRIIRDGFEVGNHTFTHSNIAKMSVQRSDVEMKLTRLLIESISGRSTILFRAPYNADSQPQTYEELEPIARSRNQNYLTIGESIDPTDWQPGVKPDSIVARTIRQLEERNASIILLHDAGGETRQATVEALPKIIAYCKSKGYKFTTVADLIGKTKDDVMPMVPGGRQGWIRKFNFYLAELTYWGSHILFVLFIVGILLSVGRMLVMGVLASIRKVTENKTSAASLHKEVTIIVPAYNEELNAVRTVRSLLQQDYPDLEVIFVDDGSKDNTYQVVSEAFKDEPRVRVFTKANGGKATALNYGINHATSDYVVCIDADTQLKSDAVSELMKKFTDENIGAVAGNVKVGNERNLITRWQSIEYITSQNYDRRAFDLINCITVIPGAIGAFRKDAVILAGGFTIDTLAEDCDLTMRLHREGYIIRNCTTAISYTEAPETIRQFLKQRFRWSFGVMQSFWKHRDTLFNPHYKNFGMIAMPNILIYQLILPILAPLADFILVISLIAASFGIIVASLEHIAFYYLIFTLVDSVGAAVAFSFEKVTMRKLFWLIPQRFIYRQLMYYILFKSFRRAVKGESQGWGVLKRTGNVKEMVTHA